MQFIFKNQVYSSYFGNSIIALFYYRYHYHKLFIFILILKIKQIIWWKNAILDIEVLIKHSLDQRWFLLRRWKTNVWWVGYLRDLHMEGRCGKFGSCCLDLHSNHIGGLHSCLKVYINNMFFKIIFSFKYYLAVIS